MRSFKEIAEYLQSQSEARSGISAIDVKILFNRFMLDVTYILQQKEDHRAVLSFIKAFEELRDQKSKEDEKGN